MRPPSLEEVRGWVLDLALPPVDHPRLENLTSIIAGAINRAWYASGEGEPSPLLCVACVLHSLGKVQHCLVDGNKRIAWHAAVTLLEQHTRLVIRATQQEVNDFVVAVADETDQPDVMAILFWLARRVG